MRQKFYHLAYAYGAGIVVLAEIMAAANGSTNYTLTDMVKKGMCKSSLFKFLVTAFLCWLPYHFILEDDK